MHDNSQMDLSRHRLQIANEKIKAAELLLNGEMYKDSIGRSYYAIFSATRAVLALDSLDFAKHAGVIACFQKNYVKEGIFNKEYSKIIMEAFQIRNRSDYDDYYIASKSDAEEQLMKAKKFVSEMGKYIENI
ncbi:MAG TPA: HEPN domain-containing protein [Lachnospiraceae bacterium]|nr:HEPN domain-containing protein [Lachnospiraceae bacterium]